MFLDTYAMIEIAIQNLNYKAYALNSEEAITTVFNLIEIHFYYLKNYGVEEAEKIYEAVKPLVIRIEDGIIKEANNFKLNHLKKRLSFADCVGYSAAKKYNAKFLTGDYMFKGLDNVEFVQ